MTTPPAGTSAAGDQARGFPRDRFTVSLYGTFVVWGWLLYSFNPSVPLLADDLDLTGAQAGLHGTAMAVGAIVSAAATPRLVRALGRRTTLLLAGATLVLGVTLLVLAPALVWTLSGVALLAAGGNTSVSAAQAGLALHHGHRASAALTEANGVGSAIGLLGPLAVGVTVGIGWGWRPAVAVTALLMVVAMVMQSRLPVGGAMTRPRSGADEGAHPDGGVPRSAGWNLAGTCFLLSIVAAIALENATTYWSTDLVIERTGADAGISVATTAGLVAGMSVIRFVVGPLSLRIPPARILAVSFLVAIAGWAVLWTATTPAMALVGLVIAGFGYGVQYPMSIALLLATADGATDAAQARATLGGGLAIGVAPFALGALADAVGTYQAFVIVPVVAVAGFIVAVVGGRALTRRTALAADVVVG
ncbi:MFS transporter [Cellulomonas soli]|uniref:Major facilitator superfamily (MFS) profile domain-containing protein n=1 Tax=Cellulomonas soli TaxID=931535 RepID=A0A512PH73_9CELL|nr:MFS transporter [Cellulomonas soli]NYI60860.1 MFS family permease [Cellulomonas soli]GEP70556.1 hypothetical protein CSO01_32710 [Cellulomonas soli]